MEPRDSTDAEGEWTWKYSFQSIGRGETGLIHGGPTETPPQQRSVHIEQANNRVLITYSQDHVTAWYTNSPAGIEQGFQIQTKPSPDQSGELVLRGIVDTDLMMSSTSAEQVTFSTAKTDVLRYAGLKVFDATGKLLPSRLSTEPEASSYSLNIWVDDSQATYPITVDPLATLPSWTAETDQAYAFFGTSVSSAGGGFPKSVRLRLPQPVLKTQVVATVA